MRILITGAAGFIGSHIADRMLAHGHKVVGIDNLSTGRWENFPKDENAKLLIADIAHLGLLDYDSHPALDEKFDLVYHCAASYRNRDAWEEDTRTNVLGTIAVVRRAIEDDVKLINFQTALCYGTKQGQEPLPTDAPIDPHGSYAVSKTAGERYIMDAVDSQGRPLNWVSFRLANVYGPRNLSGPIPTFYKRLAEGKPCTIVDSRRDFVYIDDLVWLAQAASWKGDGVYHVSTGSDYAIADLFTAVAKAMHLDAEAPVALPRGEDDAPSILLDSAFTLMDFGWTAQTLLLDGIQKAVDWYAANPPSETYTHLKMEK